MLFPMMTTFNYAEATPPDYAETATSCSSRKPSVSNRPRMRAARAAKVLMMSHTLCTTAFRSFIIDIEETITPRA